MLLSFPELSERSCIKRPHRYLVISGKRLSSVNAASGRVWVRQKFPAASGKELGNNGMLSAYSRQCKVSTALFAFLLCIKSASLDVAGIATPHSLCFRKGMVKTEGSSWLRKDCTWKDLVLLQVGSS